MSESKPEQSANQAQANPLTGKLASAASIAGPYQTSIADAISTRKHAGQAIPKLIGILATPSPPSVAYAEWTKKACEQVGIEFEIWQTWSESGEKKSDDEMDGVEQEKQQKASSDLEADVEDLIIAANSDDSIHGIMVYYPIFGGRQDTYLQQIVDPRKDVEGLHFTYCFNMYHNIRWINPAQLGGAPGTAIEASSGSADNEENIPKGYSKSILPCTPLAVVKCLESLGAYDKSLPYGDRLYGKTITVVNRSEVVGRPLAALLSNDGAKVYSVDLDSIQEFNKRAPSDSDRKPSKAVIQAREQNASHRLRPSHVVRPCTLTLQECIAASDVVISGVPAASFKIQTDWVKPGTMTVNFSSEKNFEKDVRSRANIHLPAIGKTTIAMLQRNLLRLIEYRELTSPSKGQSNHAIPNSDPKPPNGGAQGGPEDEDKEFKPDQSSGNGSQSEMSKNNLASFGSSRSSGGAGAQDEKEMDVDKDEKEEHDKELSANKPKVNERSHPANQMLSPSGPLSSLHPGHQAHPHNPSLPPRFPSANPVQAHRERAHTLSMLRPESAYVSPSVPVRPLPSNIHTGSGTQSHPSAWEWRSPGAQSDTLSSAHMPGHTPPFGPSRLTSTSASVQSPLLFAPIGGQQSHLMGHPGRVPTNHIAFRSSSMSSPRSATPVSPLIIDGLSVEDNASSSNTGPNSQRLSWDSGTPRTPHEMLDVPLPSSAGGVPSVLGRPGRSESMGFPQGQGHAPQRHHSYGGHPTFAPSQPPYGDEKMAMELEARHGYGSPYMRTVSHQGQLTSQQPPANAFARHMMQQDRIAHSRRRRRPPFSYSSLIAQAISSAPEGRMTLREIYTWISNAYPDLYSMEGSEGSGWQNTVRHNLSLNKAFIKVARTAQDIYDSCSSGVPSLSQQARGKGGWWMLDPNVNPATIGANGKGEGEDDLMLGDADVVRTLRRRRTNSSAASIASEDGAGSSSGLLSPMDAYPPAPLHHPAGVMSTGPSVLHLRGRAYTTTTMPDEEANLGGGPSVFRAARPGIVDRSISQGAQMVQPNGVVASGIVGHIGDRDNVHQHMIKSRPRGYTTSSADVDHKGGYRMNEGPHAPNRPNSSLGQRMHNVHKSPAMQGNQALLPPPQHPSNARYNASPAMQSVRSLGPAPGQQQHLQQPTTPGHGPQSGLYNVNSPNKRKLRHEDEHGPAHPSNSDHGQQSSPAFFPQRNLAGEEQSGQGAGNGYASPHQRKSMSAPSPLGGQRITLGPPPKAMGGGAQQKLSQNPRFGGMPGNLHRQASMTDLPSSTEKQSTPQAHQNASATVEREGQGSRMSITGLLS